jgi:hypothetical protein
MSRACISTGLTFVWYKVLFKAMKIVFLKLCPANFISGGGGVFGLFGGCKITESLGNVTVRGEKRWKE